MRLKILFILLLVTNLGFSQSYKDIISHLQEEDLLKLEEEGTLLNKKVTGVEGLELLPPDFSYRDEFITSFKKYDPKLSLEVLYLIDRPDMEGLDLSMYLQESILAASEQVGLEYFSFNRNKMYPLITDSYYIRKGNRKSRYSDPKIREYKESREYTLFQEDTTFGKNDYTIISRVNKDDGVIWNDMINDSSMRIFRIFKAIDPQGLKISYIIIPKDDKILLYALAQIQEPPKVKSILGKKVNISDSFRKRVDVIIKWFIEKIEE